MKALSVKQPWADLIVSGIKDIENRSWRTNFRGTIYIHASEKPVFPPLKYVNGYKDLLIYKQWVTTPPGIISELVRARYTGSAIIGEVDIVDCVQGHASVWAEKGVGDTGRPIWNWVLANAVKYERSNIERKRWFIILGSNVLNN